MRAVDGLTSERCLERGERGSTIVPVHADGKSGESQSECVVLAVPDSRLRMMDRGRSVFFMQSGAQESIMMAHRGKCMRQRIGGIKRECTFQKYKRFCRAIWHPGIDVGLSLQHEIIGIEAIWPLAFDALDFRAAQARLDRADDRERDLVLKGENIVERAIVAFGPDMSPCCGVDELPRDPHTMRQSCARCLRAHSARRVRDRPASRRPPGPCRRSSSCAR